jgi:hypothetical protein
MHAKRLAIKENKSNIVECPFEGVLKSKKMTYVHAQQSTGENMLRIDDSRRHDFHMIELN